MRVGNYRGGGTIVAASVTFAKVVGLDSRGSTTQELPIDFVEISRKQDHTTDDASAWCCFDNKFDTSKEELEVGPHCRSIIALGESKFGSLRAECDICIVGKRPLRGQSLESGKIDGVCASRKTFVVGAGAYLTREYHLALMY